MGFERGEEESAPAEATSSASPPAHQHAEVGRRRNEPAPRGTGRTEVRRRLSSSRPEPYPGASRPNTFGEWLRRLWPRFRYFIVHNILHLDDTPQRIALGVFLGFLIGATPTIGIQMIVYFGLVTVLPANKFSGLPPIWITNPITAVPVYYANWRIGIFLLTGRLETSPESRAAIARLVEGAPGQDKGFIERLFSPEFWTAAFDVLSRIGVELWVGSIFVGLVCGLVGYWATYRAVLAYRQHAREHARHGGPTASPNDSWAPSTRSKVEHNS